MEIVFLVIVKEYSFLSSSIVKEIVKFGGSVDYFVFFLILADICFFYLFF